MKRILFLLVASITLTACGGSGTNPKEQEKSKAETVHTDITEVLYFHGKQRCITCNAIEKPTKEVVHHLAKRML